MNIDFWAKSRQSVLGVYYDIEGWTEDAMTKWDEQTITAGNTTCTTGWTVTSPSAAPADGSGVTNDGDSNGSYTSDTGDNVAILKWVFTDA